MAVIDSGIEYNHPDLKNWINPTNIHRDFTVSTTDPVEAEDLSDNDGHGTHVAGIIAAEGNNEIGVTGVAWNVQLVSLKIFENNESDISNLCAAINYAADKKIPIINFSGGFYGYEYKLYSAIRGYNGLVVCSSGNDGIDVDYNNHYPSNYSDNEILSNRVISVGSIDNQGKRSSFSNYSSSGNKVNIYAPGERILSTIPYHLCLTGCNGLFHSWSSEHESRGYHYNSGTSMAAPFVASAAAVLLSANDKLSAEQLKTAIISGAKNITITIPSSDSTINQEVPFLNLYNSLKMVAYKVNGDGNIIIGRWSNSNSSLNIPDTINGIAITGIGAEAFKDNNFVESVELSNSITNIDESAFENCSYLQSVTLPMNLVAIGSSAFKGCRSLANISLPNTVTNIDSSAFENCSYLQSVTLPMNLVAIGSSAFKGCGSLGSITIPSNVQYIDESAFENCVSLVSVVVEREMSNITNLGNYAFAGCSSALQIIVPKNRVAEYKNKVYWSSYKNRIVANDDNFSEIELHCLSDFYNLTPLDVNYNKLYKLNVLCGKSYQIIADSDSDVKINLYDSNLFGKNGQVKKRHY